MPKRNQDESGLFVVDSQRRKNIAGRLGYHENGDLVRPARINWYIDCAKRTETALHSMTGGLSATGEVSRIDSEKGRLKPCLTGCGSSRFFACMSCLCVGCCHGWAC